MSRLRVDELMSENETSVRVLKDETPICSPGAKAVCAQFEVRK